MLYPFSYAAFFCCFIGVVLGIICLRLNRKAALNRTAAIAAFGYALFALSYVWVYGSSDKSTVWTAFNISTIATTLVIPNAVLIADLLFAGIPWRKQLFIVLPCASYSILLFLVTLINRVIFVDFVPTPLGNLGVLTKDLSWLNISVLFFLIQHIVTWTLLLRARARTKLKRVRQQLGLMVPVSMLFFVLFIAEQSIGKLLGLPNLDLFESLLNVAFLFFLIARFRHLRTEGVTLENEVLQAMKEAVILVESDMRVRRVNPVTKLMLGRDESDIINKEFNTLFDQADTVKGQWEAAISASKTTEIIGITVKDEEVELVLAPSFDRFGDLVGGIALVRKNDIFASVFAEYGITARERDVLFMLTQGYNRKQIADSKFISEGTVKNHIHNIYEKTGASNRVELLLMLSNKK